jgi:hypothetical protein
MAAPPTAESLLTAEEPAQLAEHLDQAVGIVVAGRERDVLAAGPPGPEITFFLGTSRPDGRPHAAGVGAVWDEGELYFRSGAGTQKARNLAANPACTISVKLEGIDLVLEGEATRVTDAETLERLAGRYGTGGGRPRWMGRGSRPRSAPERRAADVAALPLGVADRVRGRDPGAVRRDPLALPVDRRAPSLPNPLERGGPSDRLLAEHARRARSSGATLLALLCVMSG